MLTTMLRSIRKLYGRRMGALYFDDEEWRLHSSDAAEDPTLRPAKQLFGLTVKTERGESGRVEDVIVNDADFAIRYLVIRLSDSNRSVIFSPWSIEKIDWKKRTLLLEEDLETICLDLPCDFHTPVSREYEDEWHERLRRRAEPHVL